jgi:hypothetical protein
MISSGYYFAAGAPSVRHSPRPLMRGRDVAGKTRAQARREWEAVPFTSPRLRGDVKNGEACATPNIERAEQSAAIPTATMMRSKIAMRYLGWPAGCGQANNKSGND